MGTQAFSFRNVVKLLFTLFCLPHEIIGDFSGKNRGCFYRYCHNVDILCAYLITKLQQISAQAENPVHVISRKVLNL